ASAPDLVQGDVERQDERGDHGRGRTAPLARSGRRLVRDPRAGRTLVLRPLGLRPAAELVRAVGQPEKGHAQQAVGSALPCPATTRPLAAAYVHDHEPGWSRLRLRPEPYTRLAPPLVGVASVAC